MKEKKIPFIVMAVLLVSLLFPTAVFAQLPAAPPPPQTNWWFIGGIIAAATIVVGLAIYFLGRRKWGWGPA